ncbi:hypothetical protein N9043_00680 [bacterium]|nr:hypothetical protein [bacterium]
MATLSNATDCNPTITFDPADVGKTFTITQTVTDPDGLTSTTTQDITVGQSNRPPVAGFDLDNSAPTDADTVTVTSTATDPDGDALTCAFTIAEA